MWTLIICLLAMAQLGPILTTTTTTNNSNTAQSSSLIPSNSDYPTAARHLAGQVNPRVFNLEFCQLPGFEFVTVAQDSPSNFLLFTKFHFYSTRYLGQNRFSTPTGPFITAERFPGLKPIDSFHMSVLFADPRMGLKSPILQLIDGQIYRQEEGTMVLVQQLNGCPERYDILINLQADQHYGVVGTVYYPLLYLNHSNMVKCGQKSAEEFVINLHKAIAIEESDTRPLMFEWYPIGICVTRMGSYENECANRYSQPEQVARMFSCTLDDSKSRMEEKKKRITIIAVSCCFGILLFAIAGTVLWILFRQKKEIITSNIISSKIEDN